MGRGDRWVDLDLRTGQSAPRDLGGRTPVARSGGQVVVDAGEGWDVIGPDGTRHLGP